MYKNFTESSLYVHIIFEQDCSYILSIQAVQASFLSQLRQLVLLGTGCQGVEGSGHPLTEARDMAATAFSSGVRHAAMTGWRG